MKISLFLIALNLSCSVAFSQITKKTVYLEGQVISNITNNPISDVLIYLQKEKNYSFTDSAGNFRVPINILGEHHLIIQGFGFRQKDSLITVSPEPSKKLKINLIPLDIFNPDSCSYNQKSAEADILNGTPKLLKVMGDAPVTSSFKQKFELKYNVEYIVFGCLPPLEECVKTYNKTIFNYLDKKYGRKWRKEVDPVIIRRTENRK